MDNKILIKSYFPAGFCQFENNVLELTGGNEKEWISTTKKGNVMVVTELGKWNRRVAGHASTPRVSQLIEWKYKNNKLIVTIHNSITRVDNSIYVSANETDF